MCLVLSLETHNSNKNNANVLKKIDKGARHIRANYCRRTKRYLQLFELYIYITYFNRFLMIHYALRQDFKIPT